MKEVEYLGFRLSGHGIIADPTKVNTVQNYPTPVDVKQVRFFLGLASYDRWLIPTFSVIARPLYALTKTIQCSCGVILVQKHLHCWRCCSHRRQYLIFLPHSGLKQMPLDWVSKPSCLRNRRMELYDPSRMQLRHYSLIMDLLNWKPLVLCGQCATFVNTCTGLYLSCVYWPWGVKVTIEQPSPSGKLAYRGLLIQELDLHIYYCPGQKNEKANILSWSPCGSSDSSVTAVESSDPCLP